MKNIGLIRLRSGMSLSDPTLLPETDALISSISSIGGISFVEPEEDNLHVFFVMTGGSEIYFKDIYKRHPEPYILLVSGTRNSLAAALEIKTFCAKKRKRCFIVRGDRQQIADKLNSSVTYFEAERKLRGSRLGVIGSPSDWLIGSDVDYLNVKRKWGVSLIDVSMAEMFSKYDQHIVADDNLISRFQNGTNRAETLRNSLYIHGALRRICGVHKLSGFTLRCFDIVKKKQESSCLAFALLNDEGIISACEGDIPALLTMYFVFCLFEKPSFMANPATIDDKNNVAIYAHCTCPLSMTESFKLDTHFESGLGFGIKGEFAKSDITAVKISHDLKNIRAIEGKIVENLSSPSMCRSQIKVQFHDAISPLIDDPYGNHLIFIYGHHKKELEEFFSYLG